ncbi:MAG: MBL fold metallo-hydrolase [Syntrophales bacterium]|jgi:glyoxylase-like metal-dependent hydrolase (beta-lactamase superfamily II)|nr:MBL fold metallo-hydrolase [Syntrophales bacterium]
MRQAGKVVDGLWYLGREESGIYLMEGSSSSALISGGMSWIVPHVVSQVKEFQIDLKRIKKLLILHAHFDHLGVVPFFKRLLPDIKIFASKEALKILNNEAKLDTINRFSRDTAAEFGQSSVFGDFDLDWNSEIEINVVAEGDVLELGNLSLEIIETPGHSFCSISAYSPELKALFPSDSGGIPFKDAIIPSGNANYSMYQESLAKLNALEVHYFCADHCGYVTGDEARQFIKRTITAAQDFRNLVERVYRRTGSLEKTVKRLVSLAAAARPDYFLPSSILESVYREMVRHIAGDLP